MDRRTMHGRWALAAVAAGLLALPALAQDQARPEPQMLGSFADETAAIAAFNAAGLPPGSEGIAMVRGRRVTVSAEGVVRRPLAAALPGQQLQSGAGWRPPQ